MNENYTEGFLDGLCTIIVCLCAFLFAEMVFRRISSLEAELSGVKALATNAFNRQEGSHPMKNRPPESNVPKGEDPGKNPGAASIFKEDKSTDKSRSEDIIQSPVEGRSKVV